MAHPQILQKTHAPDLDAQGVALIKGGQVYRFACEPGDEPELVEALAAMARDPDEELTWFDVALIACELRRTFAERDDE